MPARFVKAEQPALAIILEHCLLPDKQADLARFMFLDGYRSWFAAPCAGLSKCFEPMVHNRVGCNIRALRSGCPGSVTTHLQYGQAILLQLDNVFAAGT